MQLRECWANALNDCSAELSREHLVSDSILQLFTKVTIRGLPWCQSPKEVGVGSLTARHLCRDHNSRLSDTDGAALALFKILRNQFDSAIKSSDDPLA